MDINISFIGIDNEWHQRYLEQASINSQLAQQIAQLEAQLNSSEGNYGYYIQYNHKC